MRCYVPNIQGCLHPNRRCPFRAQAVQFMGRWIRCQRPVLAAVGEF